MGWFTTENLFREIDRDSVAVLLLKCLDYVNGWRRGLYPWSPSCRLRRSGPAAWEQQFVLPTGWMKRYPRPGDAADRAVDPLVVGAASRRHVAAGW